MTGILIIAVFLIICILMFTKKLNAMVAIPILAFAIALIAGIPWNDATLADGTSQPGIQSLLFVSGPTRLASAMITFIFGAILSELVSVSGIAETIIRKVTEFVGEKPFLLSITLFITLSILYSTLGGLGSIIMLGSIVLPIMVSAGIEPVVAGVILLFSTSVGGTFNLANWSVYIETLKLTQEEIFKYAVFCGGIFACIGILMIAIEVKFHGLSKIIGKKSGRNGSAAWPLPETDENERTSNKAPWFSLITPLIPLVAVIGFKLNINLGFILGIVYAFFTTLKKGSMKLLAKAIIQGISNCAGALFLLIGIGMLLKVVMDTRVTTLLSPLLSATLPKTGLGYVIFFTLLAPLSLYRGPFNIWGLGLGLASVMVATGNLSASAMMAALLSTGQIQGICDPTNTGNVWTAAYLQTDVNSLLKKALPYVWTGVFLALIVAAVKYF